MAALNRAYAVLSDPLARHVYDRDRHLSPSWSATISSNFSARGRRNGRPISWATPAHTPPPPSPSTLDDSNGAGVFLGSLCLLLLLSLVGWSERYGFGSVLAAMATVGGLLGLIVVTSLFFTSNSPLARWARHWFAGEPHGYEERAAHRAASRAYRPPSHGAMPGAASLGATDDHTDDPAVWATARFERLVNESLATVPSELASYLENVVVQVENEPSAEDLKTAGVPAGHTLLGLYHGVPLTHHFGRGAPPEIITIYRKPIERISANRPARIRAQVRATVLHELAHHFGIDHDEMPSWVK
jgi:predicted Zn-dependent protease with MMP-like domain